MKRLLITLTAAAALSATVLASPAVAEDVTVTITGVHARGGEILVALQTKDEYLQPRGSYGAKTASPAAASPAGWLASVVVPWVWVASAPCSSSSIAAK